MSTIVLLLFFLALLLSLSKNVWYRALFSYPLDDYYFYKSSERRFTYTVLTLTNISVSFEACLWNLTSVNPDLSTPRFTSDL